MAHISTGVEYALHCLVYISGSAIGVKEASVRDLAEFQGVPSDYLSKLFTRLAKADLLVATEGVRGGFSLARPAEHITVWNIVEAIDGNKAIFNCREIRSNCALFGSSPPEWATCGTCSINLIMQSAEKALQNELNNYTLADVVDQTMNKAPPTFDEAVVGWFSERLKMRQ